MFVLGCCLRTNMCAYVYPSVRIYLSASCDRVSMLAFVCVHARVREVVCVSPSVRPFVCLSGCPSVRMHIRASKCLIVHACVHQCLRSCVACTRAGGRMFESVRSSVRLSVFIRAHVCASNCLFAHVCFHQCMHDIFYF